MNDNIVFFERRVDKDNVKSNIISFFRCYSWADEEDGNKRKIDLDNYSGRKVAELVKDINKDNWNKELQKAKDKELVVRDPNSDLWIVQDVVQKKGFLKMSNQFMRDVIRERKSDYVEVYKFLRGRWEDYKRGVREIPGFTQGDIIQEVFESKNRGGYAHERVRLILAQLKVDGLIDYVIVPTRSGKSFIRMLTKVTETFNAEKIIKTEDLIIENLSECGTAQDADIDVDNLTTIATDIVDDKPVVKINTSDIKQFDGDCGNEIVISLDDKLKQIQSGKDQMKERIEEYYKPKYGEDYYKSEEYQKEFPF